MNIKDYGFTPDMVTENEKGIPARVIAVHKERYALICEYGETYGRLKTKEYYGGYEEFPTVGDFVRIDYIPGSDSRIIATLPRKTFFLDETRTWGEESRQWQPILITCSSCSP